MAHRWKVGFAFLFGLVAVIPAEGADPARNGLIVYAGAVIENVQPEIYAFPLDGGRRQNISRDPGADVGPALSPDGTKIIFARRGHGLFVARADGTAQRPLTAGFASWAPDSRHVVGSIRDDTGTQVVVTDTDTAATQRVGLGEHPQ